MTHRITRALVSLLILEALSVSPAGARAVASAGRTDPPNHEQANHCLNEYGVDLNQLYGVRDKIQTAGCAEQTAGDHWVLPVEWVVHDGSGSVYPEGYQPLSARPIEDFVLKLVAVKVVVDVGTSTEQVHYFAAGEVLRTDIDSEQLYPGGFDAPYPVASMLPRLFPVSVGQHTFKVYLLMSAQHCDGFGTVVSYSCLPAGEVPYWRLLAFEVSAPAFSADQGIRTRLQTIPGLRIVDDYSSGDEYHFFRLTFRQPIDHRNPDLGWFDQRLTLMHKDTQRPMVLHTTGYGLSDYPFLAEPTQLVGGNQISVEERFFLASRPQPPDWSKLTIWQAAADHHRIVQAFAQLYPRRWLSTGISKGGMASVYHRRFFPQDVNGTIAYVAPNDVDDAEDSAYTEFLQEVGTDPDCRAALTDLQNQALGPARDGLRGALEGLEAAGLSFNRTLGSPDRALEVAVTDLPFLFWQWYGQWLCPYIPTRDAPPSETIGFIDAVAGLVYYTDQFIEPDIPYYVQAGTQLGYPSPSVDQLIDLRYPGIDQPRSYVPAEIPLTFDFGAMADIDTWVKQEGSELLFLYGERDPYSAEPFRLGAGSTDSFSFTAPQANHTARIFQLSLADQQLAIATVQRWAGVSGMPLNLPHPAVLKEPVVGRGRVTPNAFSVHRAVTDEASSKP